MAIPSSTFAISLAFGKGEEKMTTVYTSTLGTHLVHTMFAISGCKPSVVVVVV
jgi:hypothetical protein